MREPQQVSYSVNNSNTNTSSNNSDNRISGYMGNNHSTRSIRMRYRSPLTARLKQETVFSARLWPWAILRCGSDACGAVCD